MDNEYVICINNESNPASLIVGKVYRTVADAKAQAHDLVRVPRVRQHRGDRCPTDGGGRAAQGPCLPVREILPLSGGQRGGEQGIVVFDELEKSKSHLLIDQMHRYFTDTAVGRYRAGRIIPEPFFVHTDLTTGVQIADLVAYVISWSFRMARMTKPARAELSDLAN